MVANVSNTVGLVPGSAAGAVGYRRELHGQRGRALPMAAASVAGGIGGAVLLLSLPPSAFRAIVPAFIGLALILIAMQPSLVRRLERRRKPREQAGPGAITGILVSGAFGGYFGAAQGILLLSILELSVDDELQRINALKVVLAGLVNLVAGIVFVVSAHVGWAVAGLIAAGSIAGGTAGAHWGRRLAPSVLRGIVILVGIAAIVRLV